MYSVFVTVNVKPECVDDFIDLTKKNHLGSVQESGCLRFDVLRDTNDPNVFYLDELYRDESDFHAHKTTAHYNAWNNGVADMMTRSAVRSTVLFPQT